MQIPQFTFTEAKTYDLLCLSQYEMQILIDALEQQVTGKSQLGTTFDLLCRIKRVFGK
jgi:hypothetical protein